MERSCLGISDRFHEKGLEGWVRFQHQSKMKEHHMCKWRRVCGLPRAEKSEFKVYSEVTQGAGGRLGRYCEKEGCIHFFWLLCNKLPQTGLLKTIDVYSLRVQEAKNSELMVSVGTHSLQRLWERILSLIFRLLVAAGILWLVTTSLHCLITFSSMCACDLPLTLSYKDSAIAFRAQLKNPG